MAVHVSGPVFVICKTKNIYSGRGQYTGARDIEYRETAYRGISKM